MKHLIKTLIIILFLSITKSGFGFDKEYDFSVITEDNDSLFYKILDEDLCEVEIVGAEWRNQFKQRTIDINPTVDYNNMTYTLISIGDEVYFECYATGTLFIPKNIRHIGKGAFAANYFDDVIIEEGNEYYKLIDKSILTIDGKSYIMGIQQSEINIPESVERIEDYALYESHYYYNPVKVTFGNSVKYIGNNIFGPYANDKVDIFGDWSNIEYIGDQAFPFVTIDNINFSDALTHIGYLAFFDSYIKSSVYIGKNCKDFHPISFMGFMTETPKFKISEDNLWFSCDDNFIYNKDKTTLVYAYWNNEVIIPNTVTTIGEDAFRLNRPLKYVSIPNSVERIEYRAFNECENLSQITIPNSVKFIDNEAFNHCCSLEDVIIPNSVTYLGRKVFFECINLSSIELGNNLRHIGCQAFGFSKINKITIPKSVEELGIDAFYNCSNLHELIFNDCDIPIKIIDEAERTIWSYNNFLTEKTPLNKLDLNREIEYPLDLNGTKSPFWGLDNLVTVSFSSNTKTLPQDLFRDCPSLENIINMDEIEILEDRVFQDCKKLKRLNLGSSFKSFGKDVIKGCPSLMSIDVDKSNPLYESYNGVLFNKGKTSLIRYSLALISDYIIPEGVLTVEDGAFKECILPNIQFTGSVKEIGQEACMDCKSLKSVYLGENVESIGEIAFLGCENLKEIFNYSQLILEEGAESNGYVAYYADHVYNHPIRIDNFIFEQKNDTYALTSYLGNNQNLVLPENVEGLNYYIGINAFKNKNIKTIILPEGLIGIGESAFYGCPLTSIDIPNSVKYIDKMAFSDCTSLEKVHIGTGVETLGESAFNGCYSLKELWCMPQTPPACEKYIFNGVDKESCVLYVPEDSYDEYAQVSPWKDFLNLVVRVENILMDNDNCINIYTVDGKMLDNVKTYSDYESLPNGIYIINGKKVLKTR